MLKLRITFVDNEKGNEELNKALSKITNDFEVINKSDIYKGRAGSKYSNIYLDVENKITKKISQKDIKKLMEDTNLWD
ncbi:hypothetical protein [Clostridium perfringens]|uniref:hypothetical protein n=1 Tax=Clostridium perfringens TaxID=1502 RepID=UPI00234021DD|nr:hypothetical protein [Clostridium perfringens]MDC4245554.1 hypothetical protein [Clostridium perfringens]